MFCLFVCCCFFVLYNLSGMSVVSPASRFTYQSIRLHVHWGRFAYVTKLFRLHGLSRFAYIEVVWPTYMYKPKYFVKIDENHCPQLTKDSYLTVMPVKFRTLHALWLVKNLCFIRVYKITEILRTLWLVNRAAKPMFYCTGKPRFPICGYSCEEEDRRKKNSRGGIARIAKQNTSVWQTEL